MTDTELDADEARQQLYATMKSDLPFEDKAERALSIGTTYLGVERGYINKIDQETDYWKTIASTDREDGVAPPGTRLDLNKTYCRRTLREDDSIALHDAPNQGWADDVAYEEHGLRCYHGTTIEVAGEPYGTVCFSSDGRRSAPFTEEETMFAELVARLLEHELERQRTEAKIARLDRFAGAVSHDLRNPLNVAMGRLEMEREKRDTENLRVATSALDRMEDLITDVLTMARQGQDVSEMESVSLASITEGCWDSIRSPDSELRGVGDLTFRADQDRLKQLFENLFRNSVEHGSTSSRTGSGDSVEHGSTSDRQRTEDSTLVRADTGVTITVGALADGDGFFVADDGPGIPESDRQAVLEPGYSTGDEGIGLGLAIVDSIASAHDWELTITESDAGGTRFEIRDVITNE
ncbi:GAF domain-containing sensor histidine kinase [Haloparvum sp. PAK95]|uniref:GAF domain-containing sensor histidine kinase n=1 Tax=Haloparvum sp. PAK95 TaxID=3418962 RepID=UPI003D2F34C6